MTVGFKTALALACLHSFSFSALHRLAPSLPPMGAVASGSWLSHAAVAAAAAAAGAGASAATFDSDAVDDSAALCLHRANSARSAACIALLDVLAGLAGLRLWTQTEDARWAAGLAALFLAVLLTALPRASSWHAKLRTAAQGSSTTYLLLRRESRFVAARALLATAAAAAFCAAAGGQ